MLLITIIKNYKKLLMMLIGFEKIKIIMNYFVEYIFQQPQQIPIILFLS